MQVGRGRSSIAELADSGFCISTIRATLWLSSTMCSSDSCFSEILGLGKHVCYADSRTTNFTHLTSPPSGIFLVYDITSERSFQHIMKWASDVDEYAPDKVQKILVGNKSDEVDKRQVATEQGVKLAKAYGMDFFETSAFTNHNITETFTRLAEQVLAANKKDLDLLRMSINDELNLTALEEEEGLCDSAAGEQGKGCWC
uniref:small monomeric GTPase n=1 Tax=Oreochromis aureus TaxID=47969 RepID=A0A668SGF2_OREAU